ncbi:MAG: hypothetical protein LBS23_01840 [Holosporaceae bacterium]|jgi:hypothetical protein|nr:hypothetical protein [Holosporaceae bacterium]
MNTEDLNLLKNEDFKRWKKLFPPTVSDEILIMKWKCGMKKIEELSRKVPKEEKKQIIADWDALLPNMKRRTFTPSRIYFDKFIGPMGISIELWFRHSNREYEFSICIFTHLNDNGALGVRSLSITGNKHQEKYLKEFERVKNEFLLPLEEPISVSEIFDAFRKYSEKFALSTDSPEIPALIAAWAGMNDLAKEAADWAEKYLRKQIDEINKNRGNNPVVMELIAAWASMDDRARENKNWADEILSKQINKDVKNSSSIIGPLIPVKGSDNLFRTPNGPSMYITLSGPATIGSYTFKNYTSFEDWREKFDARLADRAGLQKLFEDKIKEHKLEKVPKEELILE